MELIKFNPDIHLNSNSKIWLINFSEYYLNELCIKWDILDKIAGCWDDVPFRQGQKEFKGNSITVTNYDYVDGMEDNIILLILDSYPNGRFDLFKKRSEISDHFNEIYYFSDDEMETELQYKDKYIAFPLEDIIVFRSGAGSSRYIPGADFGDNARALFEYMLSEGYDKFYKLVWIVKNPENYKENYEDRRVEFISYDDAVCGDEVVRDNYYKNLFLAKYIFFTDSAVFCKNSRKDQVRVQLWHGCGLKSLRKTLVGCDEYKYEYMTVISKLYAKLHVDDFGLREDQLLVTGYPKDDMLYHPVDGWNDMFGIPDAEKYIFWLPTWRTTALSDEAQGSVKNQTTGMPILENMEDMINLNGILEELNTVLVIKLHPWQDRKTLGEWKLPNIILLENQDLVDYDVQISEILGHASALISDYSSVAIDFTLLDRPIAFTLDDQDSYRNDRGFLWDDICSWLPGVEVENYDDMVAFIKNVDSGIDTSCEKRRRLNGIFHDFDDDQNANRVLEALGIKNATT